MSQGAATVGRPGFPCKNAMQQLAELVTIQTGYVRGKVEPTPGGPYHVIEPSHIDGRGEIQYDALTPADSIDPKERHLICQGDILFTPRGASNKAACVTRPLSNTTASSQLYILRAEDPLDPAYLAWYLNQRRAQEYFDTFARGATIRSINKQILQELSVPVPPIGRQRLIAKIAGLARREADLTHQLQEKRQLLTQNVLLEAAK